MGVNVVQRKGTFWGFCSTFYNEKCHWIADGEMFPIRMRKLDNISVRQTYRWIARFVGFLVMYPVSTSTSGLMRNLQKRNNDSAKSRMLAASFLPCCHLPPAYRISSNGSQGSDRIVLIQTAGFYYRKYGINEWTSVGHRPLLELRFGYACCHSTIRVR